MSIWQFQAAVGGYIKANSLEEAAGLQSAEADRLAELIDSAPVWH